MSTDLDAEIAHDLLEYLAAGDGAVIRINQTGPPTERELLDRLRRHGVEQKAQRCLHVLPIDAVIFLVGHAAAVIDHAVEHQQGLPAAFVDPRRLGNMLEVRRTQIEVPAFVAVPGLKAHRRRRPAQGVEVVAPALQIAVERRYRQQTRRHLDEAPRRLQAMDFEQSDGLCGGQVSALFVAGAQLDGGDQLTVAGHLRLGQNPRLAVVGALQGAGPKTLAQHPVERRLGDAIEPGRVLHHPPAFGAARRQHAQAPAQVEQRLGRNRLIRHPPCPLPLAQIA